MLCVWNLPLFSIFLSYKCKLVTIAYWTIFNNTINTRWSRTLLSFFRFPSSWRATGTPYSSARFPAITTTTTMTTTTILFPFSPIIFLSLSLSLSLRLFSSFSLSLYSCSDDCALPLRRLLFTLLCTHSLFPRVFLAGFYRTDLRLVIDWAKCINYGGIFAVKCRNFHYD